MNCDGKKEGRDTALGTPRLPTVTPGSGGQPPARGRGGRGRQPERQAHRASVAGSRGSTGSCLFDRRYKDEPFTGCRENDDEVIKGQRPSYAKLQVSSRR